MPDPTAPNNPSSASTICLIVNADDLGLSVGVNDGIFAAHKFGIVTSASLMVRQPGAQNAVERAINFPNLGLGLHLDLGEWTCTNGNWHELYRVVDATNSQAVREEVREQFKQFESLVGKKPTHLDSHQHAHRDEPVRAIVSQCAQEWGLPVRHFIPHVRYLGDFYGQYGAGSPLPEAITIEGMLKTLARLECGITELACHPGYDDHLETMYCRERQQEVTTLCDPRIRKFLQEHNIRLMHFGELDG